jgi:predicted amidohydrolase
MAACQMNTQADKAANLRTAERLIDEAAAAGADIVALPEMFNIYGTKEEIRSGREPEGGPTSEFLSRLAQRHGIYIHGGSIPIAIPGSDKSWNATYVFDPAGAMIASYRKIHLFDIDFSGQVEANESSRYDTIGKH